MNKHPPLYQSGDIVLYKHRVTAVDFAPVKIVAFLGWTEIGTVWYIVVDERQVLTGMPEDWLKSADDLTAKQISRLTGAESRKEQLASLTPSVIRQHKLRRES